MATAVILVCGPPCSGKSTYVDQHRAVGDLVVDLDAIYHAIGAPAAHGPYSPALLPFAFAARDALLGRLREPNDVQRAWLIAGAPRRRDRRTYHPRQIIMMSTPLEECIRRAQADGRAPQTIDWIRQWWAEYQPD